MSRKAPISWLRRAARIFIAIILLLTVLAIHYYCKGYSHSAREHARIAESRPVGEDESARLAEKLALLRHYAAQHGYNLRVAFFADMRIASGKNRFFVCDLSRDSILLAGLVAHGSGNRTFSLNPSFSNIDGSGCSSLGRYKIGQPYKGRFGPAYKLYGLDSSNDRAFRRNIVLHAYECVPEAETAPYPICNSLGCAMVSPGFLRRLQPVIDGSKRPILLWVFD